MSEVELEMSEVEVEMGENELEMREALGIDAERPIL